MRLDHLRAKYRGAIAESYEARRTGTEKWRIEQAAIESLIPRLAGPVLDAPCGTGRFMAAVNAAGKLYVGVDISGDMLSVALHQPVASEARHILLEADILAVPLAARSMGSAICARFLNWLEPDDAAAAVAELARVASRSVVVSMGVVPVGSPRSGRSPGSVYHDARAVRSWFDAHRFSLTCTVPLGGDHEKQSAVARFDRY